MKCLPSARDLLYQDNLDVRQRTVYPGAGCGMGANIAKAALATGNAVIVTGITKEAR
jgi:hypothetical protein